MGKQKGKALESIIKQSSKSFKLSTVESGWNLNHAFVTSTGSIYWEVDLDIIKANDQNYWRKCEKYKLTVPGKKDNNIKTQNRRYPFCFKRRSF